MSHTSPAPAGRLRAHPGIRRSLTETTLKARHLIAPLFVTEQSSQAGPVESLPGVERLTVDDALRAAERVAELGVGGVLLFFAVLFYAITIVRMGD